MTVKFLMAMYFFVHINLNFFVWVDQVGEGNGYYLAATVCFFLFLLFQSDTGSGGSKTKAKASDPLFGDEDNITPVPAKLSTEKKKNKHPQVTYILWVRGFFLFLGGGEGGGAKVSIFTIPFKL